MARVGCALLLVVAAALRAQMPAPRSAGPAAATGVLSGRVYDSVSTLPLAGAMVQFVLRDRPEMAYGATTDYRGRFRLEEMQPGEYLAGFVHPALDSLGIESVPLVTTRVTAGEESDVVLAVPSGATLARAHCGQYRGKDSVGVLVGYVVDADAGTPMVGAKVVVSWAEITIDRRGLHTDQRRAAAVADERGFYVHCRLPSDVELLTDATLADRHSGLVELRVPPFGLRRRNMAVDATSAAASSGTSAGARTADSGARARPAFERGHARLQGRVYDIRARPLAGAVVGVWGTDVVGKTGEDGRFRLDSLPAGTHMVEARSIGYAPVREVADLSNVRTASVGLMLERQSTVLAGVTVYGKRRAQWGDLEGFARRSRRGMGGYFMSREDIEARRLTTVTDLLRTVPGVHVTPKGSFGGEVTLRGNCAPAVYIDGTLAADPDVDMLMDASDLGAVEVYQGAGQTPVEYSARAGGTCGAILLWSKR